MAFDKSKFTSIAAQTLSSNAEMHWLYETTDTSKDVYLSANGVLGNYFSEVYNDPKRIITNFDKYFSPMLGTSFNELIEKWPVWLRKPF